MIQLAEQTLFADRYLFKRLLGRGGFSEVWLATDNITGLDIAVKVYAPGQGLDTDGMTDFCTELSQVYNLNNTYLLKPQHVDNWEGMPYLVMTYCKKGSCHRLIGTMNEKQIWKLLHDVSSGLAYLHEQGIIHQDIKPDNILVDNSDNYVITDFGISVKSRRTLRRSMSIASGSGTTAYMGPERFSEDPTPLKASDIWSLGATAYELLTGNVPFGEIGGGMQSSGAELPTIKKNVSPQLRMVLAQMMALETWDRPTAAQIAQWAEDPSQVELTAMPPRAVHRTNPQPRPASKLRKWKGLIIGLSVAALIVVLGAVVWHMAEVKKADEEKAKKEQELQEESKTVRDIHREKEKECDKWINAIKEEEFEENFVNAVEALRDLEDFESRPHYTKDSTLIELKKTVLKKEMDRFQRKLESVRDRAARKVEQFGKEEYMKIGSTYNECKKAIPMIDRALEYLDGSGNKSAKGIPTSSSSVNEEE